MNTSYTNDSKDEIEQRIKKCLTKSNSEKKGRKPANYGVRKCEVCGKPYAAKSHGSIRCASCILERWVDDIATYYGD